jgi:hypothetical protein
VFEREGSAKDAGSHSHNGHDRAANHLSQHRNLADEHGGSGNRTPDDSSSRS